MYPIVAPWTAISLTAVSLLGIAAGPSAAADGCCGAQLAATCASCHHPGGGDRSIPSIVGLSEDRLTRAMLAYRASERPNHVMRAVALALSDEEIASVARFLSARDEKAMPP
jgi:sulfide dehydrogenase cytochrome subunit